MDNYTLFSERADIIELSSFLGFSKTFFKGNDFEIITAFSKKELLTKIQQLRFRNIKILFKPMTEEMLRFALERAPIDGVIGVEEIHPTDSLHYVRGGLDQILCKIAKENEKMIFFSFSSILNSPQRPRLLARIMFNLELCQKYGVKTIFNNFALTPEEMRSAADLRAFERILMKTFLK